MTLKQIIESIIDNALRQAEKEGKLDYSEWRKKQRDNSDGKR